MFDCSAPLRYKRCKTCHELACEKLLKMHREFTCQNAVLQPKQCSTCSYLTYSELMLLVHTNSKEKHCHLYWELSMNRNNTHVVSTADTKWFKCDICEHFRSEHETELINHMERTHHGYSLELVRWWGCDFCTYRHKHKFRVLQHTNLKHAIGSDIKWFSCELCEYKSKSCPCLHRHNRNKHMAYRNITWHQCKMCSYKTNIGANLRLHVGKKHTLRSVQICSVCGAQCIDLKAHMRYNHAQDTTWFKCPKCPFTTRKKHDLSDHVNVLHTESETMKWYYCDKCPYKSNRRTTLGSHFRNNHKRRAEVLSCDKCDYKTNFKRWLKNHISYNHTPEAHIKWHSCEVCDYKSKTAGNLKLHVNRRHVKKETQVIDKKL